MSGQDRAGRTIVGIVIYHPDEAELARLVASVSGDASEVVLYCNSPFPPEAEDRLREVASTLTVVRPGSNRGLGTAYNVFVARARETGCRFLLLFDQDSLPGPDMIARLAAVHDALRQAGERPAIVGPRPVGQDGAALKIPSLSDASRSGAIPVSFVISSGSLIDVEAAARVGEFREDFFIDAIDIEWCLRARSVGFSIWVADAVRMDHRLGRGIIRLPFGVHLADQPPRRLYTYLRNQIAMVGLPHVPAGYKWKTMLSMPARLLVHLARNRFSAEHLSAIGRGVRDGMTGRFGSGDGGV